LIGIKSNGKKNREAIHFLEDLIKGQKVFLRFDETKYDKDNNILCYLYLKNKTCVNTHLIKNKLVDVETIYDYRMKGRFLTLCNQKVLS
jgi:site-specific DNA-methyltransferase (adenine-specific)